MMFRLIVFDLDVTLVDSKRDIAESANATLVACGAPSLPEDDIGRMVGDGAPMLVARAFAADPSVLFADEPTGNLDSATGEEIISLMFELNRVARTTLLLVTHDEVLAQRCPRRIGLAAGRLTNDERR
jgi:predicted ABC-type transport system involved in lysophospholipase L1 biosynthesis ATPase subunit